jgi:hypothetical protein
MLGLCSHIVCLWLKGECRGGSKNGRKQVVRCAQDDNQKAKATADAGSLVCFDLGRKYGLRFGGEAAIP